MSQAEGVLLETLTALAAAQLLAGPIYTIDAGALVPAPGVDDVAMTTSGDTLFVAWTDQRRTSGYVRELNRLDSRDLYLARVRDVQGATALVGGQSRVLCVASTAAQFAGVSMASDGGKVFIAWRNERAHPGLRLIAVDASGAVQGRCSDNFIAEGDGGAIVGPEVAVANGRTRVVYAQGASLHGFDVGLDGGAVLSGARETIVLSAPARALSLAGTGLRRFVIGVSTTTSNAEVHREQAPSSWDSVTVNASQVRELVLAPGESQALIVQQWFGGTLKSSLSGTPTATNNLAVAADPRAPLVVAESGGYVLLGAANGSALSTSLDTNGEQSGINVSPFPLAPGAEPRAMAAHPTLGVQVAVVPDGGLGVALQALGATFIGPGSQLARHGAPQSEPSLAWLPDAGFLVAWREVASPAGRIARLGSDGLAPFPRQQSTAPVLLAIGSEPSTGRLAALVENRTSGGAVEVASITPAGELDRDVSATTNVEVDRLTVGVRRSLSWRRAQTGANAALVLTEGTSSHPHAATTPVNALGRCGAAGGGALWLPAFASDGRLLLFRFDEAAPLNTPPEELDTGVLQPQPGPDARPCAAAQGTQLAITWGSANGVRVTRYDTVNRRTLENEPLTVSNRGNADRFPVIAPLSDGWVVAWEAEALTVPRVDGALVSPAGAVTSEPALTQANEEARAPRLLSSNSFGEVALAWTAFDALEARVALRLRVLTLPGGTFPDGGFPADAGEAEDAGLVFDGGVPDGGDEDAGSGLDAGTRDAGADGGSDGEPDLARFASCGCAAVDGAAVASALALLLLAASRRRRR